MYGKFGNKMILCPIIDWKEIDVWDYIRSNNIPYPSLYDNGHDRIGCILCPLKCIRRQMQDYYEYPAHVRAIERAIGKYLENRPNSSLWKWGKNTQEIVMMWIANTPTTDDSGQCNLLEVSAE